MFPRRYFRGMILLAVLVLCGYGLWAVVESICRGDEKMRIEGLVVKADSALLAQEERRWKRDSVGGERKRVYRKLNIEINGADSAMLVKVYGIGKVFAKRIIEYRERLGGFVSVEQLKEVKGVDDEKFEQIFRNFNVDSSKIKKININFAPACDLVKHPYVTKSMAKRVEKYRLTKNKKSKGGICNLKELVENDILLPSEVRRLAPYFTYEIF